MADKLAGIEASAVSLLTRAVELDNARRFTESLVCYQEGIQLLIDALKGITNDESKKQAYRKRVEGYMVRAEKLKQHIEAEKEAGQYHEQIQIENNSTGHSYQKIFERFLDETVTQVEVEDPYIRSVHQVYNFLRFCELLVKSKGNVKIITLTTGRDDDPRFEQEKRLEEIGKSLTKFNIKLEITYSASLHDREIRFNNGWIIKIGRGLDYFKASEGKFHLGYCDYDLRPCHETTVDIFHKKYTQKKYSS